MIVALLLCASVTNTLAQSEGKHPIIFNVLVIDMNKLVGQSSVGQALQAQYEQAKFMLNNEFNNLKTELIAEEQRLSEIRSHTEVADFRQMAKEFDQRST